MPHGPTRNLVLSALLASAFSICLFQYLHQANPRPRVSQSTEPALVPLDWKNMRQIQPRAEGVSDRVGAEFVESGIDRNVRLAAGAVSSVATIVSAVPGADGFSLQSVKQGDYTWEIKGSDVLEVDLLSRTAVDLQFNGAVGMDVRIRRAADSEVIHTGKTDDKGVLRILNPLEVFGETVQRTVVIETMPNPISRVTLLVRLPMPASTAPKVTHVQSNRFGSRSHQLTPNVYDRYLRLFGQGMPPGGKMQFHVYSKAAQGHTFFAVASIVGEPLIQPDTVWDAELSLPTPTMPPGEDYELHLLAWDKESQGYVVLDKPLKFKKINGANLLKTSPKIVMDNLDTSQPDKRPRTKTRRLKLKVETDSGEESKSDSHVAVYEEGGKEPLGVSSVPPVANADVEVAIPRDGPIRLQAAYVLGSTVGKASDPVELLVSTTGPKVLSVEPSNLSLSRDRKSLRILFDPSVPLAPSVNFSSADKAAVKTAIVSLVGKATGKIDVATITLDSSENALDVTFVKEFAPDVYTLSIARELSDVFGNPLSPNFTATLIMPLGGELPFVAPGVSGPTGPHVEFPEYTKPRPVDNGFNPSDHVETRVSRLYFFRDAHRVAQIVNRDVKSYNRVAVEMQQQLANKSRQIADQATDDRRVKEREAERLAQQSRDAERELAAAEATAVRGANEAANANAELRRKEDLLRNPATSPSGTEGELLRGEIRQLQGVITSLESVAAAARSEASAAANKVQRLRDQEAQAKEKWQSAIAVEDRAREEQFRREVAAANTDPDTYAPGKPESRDPVRQVSVSVVGEGMIQLRGPIKGVNEIRTMINQLDAPVGQVRVNVHTVQINGEHGNKMELVASNIQRYIDHSRFLTLQSAEMFRKAIVQVAAQKAYQAGTVPGITQDERDRKYLYSFFGEDFIRELETLDSEFLRTGNKLLSIHSMDTTSLAAAMFVLALAKNSTRSEILQTFEGMMASELPQAEQNYFEAGLTCDGKHQLFDKHCKRSDFQLLSQNAKFQSIRGMFDIEISDDDIMNPMQREFLRLAQIFKSQLIVEMELRQRIMERAVIEERLGDRERDLANAAAKETTALQELDKAQKSQQAAQRTVLVASTPVLGFAQQLSMESANTRQLANDAREILFPLITGLLQWDSNQLPLVPPETLKKATEEQRAKLKELNDELWARFKGLTTDESVGPIVRDYVNRVRAIFGADPLKGEAARLLKIEAAGVPLRPFEYRISPEGQLAFELPKTTSDSLKNDPTALQRAQADVTAAKSAFDAQITAVVPSLRKVESLLPKIRLRSQKQELIPFVADRLELIEDRSKRNGKQIDDLIYAWQISDRVAQELEEASRRADEPVAALNQIVAAIAQPDGDPQRLYHQWTGVIEQLRGLLSDQAWARYEPEIATANNAFRQLLQSGLDYQFARRQADASRRPLDHKKFLDMLVDEMQDKYIELLEGTRAHTANIDAYIKRLMTALDDDFNTQFYYPTFRKVREASWMYDVQLGQVETTNVLANNRAFAKVSPQATMEFDLPKRDILIAEALNGAKATIDDIGALAQDPTFLSLAKLKSGQPTSSPTAGATGGMSTVRNVLPGLSTDTAEAVLGQQGPGASQFGAAMEGLIPDPAIYKFETGTGWEIRPVIQPDGQAVVFHFNYMYTTNVREPVRADEKHLGRVKRHFVDTDVQLSNFELREISRYTVALKASRTAHGVPLFENLPVVGALWRPLPSDESSLQQNIILGQSTIFPTLFDLMGLRWAPVVADLDPLRLSNDEFIVRNRRRALMNRVFDHSSSQVDEFLRIPEGERRMDLYRSQESIPSQHPNGYQGPGANLRDSELQEGYTPGGTGGSSPAGAASGRPEPQYIPGESREGSPFRRRRDLGLEMQPVESPPLDAPRREPSQATQPEEIPAVDLGPMNGEAPPRFDAARQLERSSRREPNPAESRVSPASYAAEVDARRIEDARIRGENASRSEPFDRSRPQMRRLPKVEASPRSQN